MRIVYEKIFHQEFNVYRDLTPPTKPYKTMVAMRQQQNGAVMTVILKEIDEKRTAIYEGLMQHWNPYIAQVYEVLCVKADEGTRPDRFFAVTEYVYALGSTEEETLSLTQYIVKYDPLCEKHALSVAIQICEGLKPLHQCGLIHRDIKPDNIMMACCVPELAHIKIIDFGGGKQYCPGHSADTTVVGTVGFQAPESLAFNTTARADIYSIGCVLNFMLTGHEPGVVRYVRQHETAGIIEKSHLQRPCPPLFVSRPAGKMAETRGGNKGD